MSHIIVSAFTTYGFSVSIVNASWNASVLETPFGWCIRFISNEIQHVEFVQLLKIWMICMGVSGFAIASIFDVAAMDEPLASSI